MRHHCVESAGQVNVVTVDKGDNVASRAFEALVDCVYLAAIFFAFPVGQFVFVAADDGNAFIGAATVDDDVLERLITLIQNRQDRLFRNRPWLNDGVMMLSLIAINCWTGFQDLQN